MKVIKDRTIVEDAWQLVDDDAAIPAEGYAIVSLSRWNREHEEWKALGVPLGVVIRSDESPSDLQALDQLSLIAIDFPKFSDGRGYTSARLLRDRLGYTGELRAIGDVLRDQLFYMHRCGINSFALKPGKNIEQALSAFDDFTVTYQAAADDSRPLFRRVAR